MYLCTAPATIWLDLRILVVFLLHRTHLISVVRDEVSSAWLWYQHQHHLYQHQHILHTEGPKTKKIHEAILRKSKSPSELLDDKGSMERKRQTQNTVRICILISFKFCVWWHSHGPRLWGCRSWVWWCHREAWGARIWASDLRSVCQPSCLCTSTPPPSPA